MTRAAIIIIALALAGIAHSRTKTSTHPLTSAEKEVEMIADMEQQPGDTIPNQVNPHAISIKGYCKKAGDSRETFFVTNKTNHRISQIKLLLRYFAMDGQLLHERVVTVNVSLNPGDTKLSWIKSWDIHRQFYYYGGTKPRKAATPFKIAYRLIGYSIPVGE